MITKRKILKILLPVLALLFSLDLAAQEYTDPYPPLSKKAAKELSRIEHYGWDPRINDFAPDAYSSLVIEWAAGKPVKATEIHFLGGDSLVRIFTDFIYKPNQLDFISMSLPVPDWTHRQVEEFHKWSGQDPPPSKELITYDSSGKEIRHEYLEYENGKYEPHFKDEVIIDSRGHHTGEAQYTWGNNKWNLFEGFRSLNTYDTNGLVSHSKHEMCEVGAGTWEPAGESFYTYRSDGTPLSRVSTTFFGSSAWKDSVVYEWHKFSVPFPVESFNDFNTGGNLLKSKTSYMYDDWSGTWYENDQQTFSYNPGDLITIMQRNNFNGSSWEPSFRLLWEYYPNGDYKTKRQASYDEATGAWEVSDKQTFDNQYDQDGDIVYSIGYDGLLKYKNVYSYGGGSSIDKQKTGESLWVYPNPASSMVNIDLPAESLPANMIVTDLAGKIVKAEILYNGRAIDIGRLEKGIYLIEVENQGIRYHAKFLKR